MNKYIPKYPPQEAVTTAVLMPRASLAALQWAADRAGLSYGIFTQRLKPNEEALIQLEYEDMLRQRRVELALRATQRVDIIPATDEFIIENNVSFPDEEDQEYQ